MKMHFDYATKVLGFKIAELQALNEPEKITELKNAIEVLMHGQGFLTKDKPIQIKFYDDYAGK